MEARRFNLDAFFGIQENVSRLGNSGQPAIQTVAADSSGNYLIAGIPTQSGLTLSASNGGVSSTTNINVSGVQEVDFVLPATLPVIIAVIATTNGVEVTQALQGTTVQVTVVATIPPAARTVSTMSGCPMAIPRISPLDAPTVNWPLPNAAGLQIMYVSVRDTFGGHATARSPSRPIWRAIRRHRG